MNSGLKLNLFVLLNLIALNLNSNVLENSKASFKTALATYSTYFMTKALGKEIIKETIESIKEKNITIELEKNLVQTIPVLTGNFFLLKDSIYRSNEKEENSNKNYKISQSLKALFTKKNGYISVAKSLICLTNILSTLVSYKYAEKDYLDQDLNKESIIACLPAFYGIYRLAQSSKKSFDKAYNEIN